MSSDYDENMLLNEPFGVKLLYEQCVYKFQNCDDPRLQTLMQRNNCREVSSFGSISIMNNMILQYINYCRSLQSYNEVRLSDCICNGTTMQVHIGDDFISVSTNGANNRKEYKVIVLL